MRKRIYFHIKYYIINNGRCQRFDPKKGNKPKKSIAKNLPPVDIFWEKGYNNRMEKYKHDRQFTVRYSEVDFKDEMKISSVLSCLQEIACSSADELGFGYNFLQPQGIAFLLSGTYLQFNRPIRLGEKITARTWPTPPSYAVFGREYQIFDEKGEPLVNATSRWCAVQLNAGKILQSKFLFGQDYSGYNTDKALEISSPKIPQFDVEKEGELRYTMTVAHADYDHYFHVNNARYADYCANAFTLEEWSNWRLKSFFITYAKQCRAGDKLSFYRKPLERGEYLVQGVNGDGQTVVCTRFAFETTATTAP